MSVFFHYPCFFYVKYTDSLRTKLYLEITFCDPHKKESQIVQLLLNFLDVATLFSKTQGSTTSFRSQPETFYLYNGISLRNDWFYSLDYNLARPFMWNGVAFFFKKIDFQASLHLFIYWLDLSLQGIIWERSTFGNLNHKNVFALALGIETHMVSKNCNQSWLFPVFELTFHLLTTNLNSSIRLSIDHITLTEGHSSKENHCFWSLHQSSDRPNVPKRDVKMIFLPIQTHLSP